MEPDFLVLEYLKFQFKLRQQFVCVLIDRIQNSASAELRANFKHRIKFKRIQLQLEGIEPPLSLGCNTYAYHDF